LGKERDAERKKTARAAKPGRLPACQALNAEIEFSGGRLQFPSNQSGKNLKF
jgi:hypothetical protein